MAQEESNGVEDKSALVLLETLLTRPKTEFETALREFGPESVIDFRFVDLEEWCRKRNIEELRVSHVSFEKRFVDFSGCNFGGLKVDFSHSKFQGGVSFSSTTINGGGTLIFDKCFLVNAAFQSVRWAGDGEVRFCDATLTGTTRFSFRYLGADRLVSFRGSTPYPNNKNVASKISGFVYIELSEHCGGSLDFGLAIFGAKLVEISGGFNGAGCHTEINFSYSMWRGGTLRFQQLVLKTDAPKKHKLDPAPTQLNFHSADLSALESFELGSTKTSRAGIDFSQTVFPTDGASLLSFGDLDGEVSFNHAVFNAAVKIGQLPGSTWFAPFSFFGARFLGPVTLDRLRFEAVPDFTGTMIEHHLSFHGLEYHQGRKFGKEHDYNRAAKLLRLKELANQCGDHGLALRCHADEMRDQRWGGSSGMGFWASLLDALYDYTSLYGQAILRPFLLLILSWSAFGWLYLQLSEKPEGLEPLVLSWGLTVPFLTVSGIGRNHYMSLASDATDSAFVVVLMSVQSLISFVLLFLIGLGLRNRFRI